MSMFHRLSSGWYEVEERLTLQGRIRTNGAGVMAATTRVPAYGWTFTRTGVGLATLQLTEPDGTAMGVPAIESAAAWLQLNVAPAGAVNAQSVEPIAISASAGTVTFRCLDGDGNVVEWPVDNANNQVHFRVTCSITTTAP